MALSLVFSPAWDADDLPRIPLVAGLSLIQVLPGPNNLKWPNDLVRGPDKLGGILVERSDDTVVVGVGVNLWWPGAPDGYGAIFGEDPGPITHLEIAERWAVEFLRRVAGDASEWGRDEYRAVCSTVGREITWDPGGSGTAVDVDDDGALLVETESGVERLASGAVREVRGIEPPA
jgi:BirA family biotin operon repressor/biotin-[acetyl-CoA-carboxylase] ligase